MAMVAIPILIGVAAIAAIWVMLTFNALVRKRTMVREGWSGIETQLKRRANLIPNLVETVKGYAAHERTTLEQVTQMRARAADATGVADRAAAERALTAAIGKIMAVAESYPDLKANQGFLSLQADLAKTEDEIQLARRYYNGTVRDLNITVQSFPANVIATPFGFKTAEFFEIEDATEREVPKVSFDAKPA
jgi:LemA protein